jgi:membrane fusion protein (multidrug efflux system)
MFVDASQSLGATEHALIVPARSLVPVLDGAQIYKVVDGKAVSVNVTIGQRTPESVEITQGLAKSDVVITDGQMKLKNGMPVKIQS